MEGQRPLRLADGEGAAGIRTPLYAKVVAPIADQYGLDSRLCGNDEELAEESPLAEAI